MNIPTDLKYTKTDEWVRTDGKTAIIGITDFAQQQLSDIVYAEIKFSIGEIAVKGAALATVESVKAAADVNLPLSGKVIEVNSDLSGSPEMLNQDPYGKAWIVKVEFSNEAELKELLDSASYATHCQSRGH